jgi:hypothetical protein
MAIELNPQKRSKTSLLTTIMGIVAVFLVLVFLGTYLYFYIVNKGLTEKTDKIIEDSRGLDQNIKSKEDELLVFQKRLSDFSSLILGHKNVGNIFKFVNENTIPTIWFNEFNYDESEEGAFLLSGQASSFFLIEQQIVVFRSKDLVKDARLSEVEIDDKTGLINFTIRITMDLGVFAFEQKQAEPMLQVETPTQQ